MCTFGILLLCAGVLWLELQEVEGRGFLSKTLWDTPQERNSHKLFAPPSLNQLFFSACNPAIHYTDQIPSPLLLLPSALQMNSGIHVQRSRHPPQTANHSKACKGGWGVGGWSGVFEYDRCFPAGLLLSAAVTFRSPFTHFTCSAAAPSVGGKGEICDPSSGAAEKVLHFL